jgi:hypothetical protein
MDIKDLNELRSDFEALQKRNSFSDCADDSCISDEDAREDYPDYLKAIYAEIMPPEKSGIYFSRWDLKTMAAELDESFAIDVRERMFQKFMQWIATPDDMKAVIGEFTKLIDMKTSMYREYAIKYPSTEEIFEKKIKKAENAKKYLDKVYVEFFT